MVDRPDAVVFAEKHGLFAGFTSMSDPEVGWARITSNFCVCQGVDCSQYPLVSARSATLAGAKIAVRSVQPI
jgi:hypothetical protein